MLKPFATLFRWLVGKQICCWPISETQTCDQPASVMVDDVPACQDCVNQMNIGVI